MALTALAIRQAKAGDKAVKLFDGQGLFLHVAPSGTKSWRMKYRFGPKEKLLTFGRFPEVSLTEARERRDAARAHLRANRDPGIEAERDRMAAIEAAGARFEVTARAWHDDERPRWTPQYARVVMNALTRDVFPDLGSVPIADITGPMILRTVRKIERRGSIETAKRVLTYISSVFVRAKGEHLVSGNPTENLIDALKPTPKGSKQPALTTLADLHTLQRVVEGSTSGPAIKLASRLLAITAVRIGVLRTALWKEFEGIDWEANTPSPKAVWRIPAERMKLDMENKNDEAFDHDVPLPPPAVEALRALHLLTGRGRLLFPGQRSARVPMSDAATSTLYKRMDGGRYKGRHVPHGWRAAFSTIMNEWAMEHGKEGDRMLIDLMLAHKPSGVSGSEFAYMRAKFAARRRVLAGVWADMIAGGLDDPMTIVADQAR